MNITPIICLHPEPFRRSGATTSIRKWNKMSVTHLFVLLLASAVAYGMKFDYQISEGHARFTENIEANLERNTVKYYTPAHNDVLESYKMMDYNKKMQITCLPSLRQCRSRNIDVEELTWDAGTVVESFVHSWNKGDNRINSQYSKLIEELYYIDNEEDLANNTLTLGEDLGKFFENYGKDEIGGFPLYKEKKLPENAVLFNITRNRVNRKKRSYPSLRSGCEVEPFYGIDSGRQCSFIKICNTTTVINREDVFADCNNVHIVLPTVLKCVCCKGFLPSTYTNDKCKCIKLKGLL